MSAVSYIYEVVDQICHFFGQIGTVFSRKRKSPAEDIREKLEQFQVSFDKLSLGAKLAFYENVIDPSADSLYRLCSKVEKLEINALVDDVQKVLILPNHKYCSREFEMFRRHLEGRIFEYDLQDCGLLSEFQYLIKKSPLLIPSCGKAAHRVSGLLARSVATVSNNIIREFSAMSLAQQRLVLRYFGGENSLSARLNSTITKKLDNVYYADKNQKQEFIGKLFAQLPNPSSAYHVKLKNKILTNHQLSDLPIAERGKPPILWRRNLFNSLASVALPPSPPAPLPKVANLSDVLSRPRVPS